MLYMVELQVSQEHRDAAMRYFWEHGSTHYEGMVTVKGAWVATSEHVAYVLVTLEDPARLESACEPLLRFGTVTTRHVTDVDEI